MSKGGKNKQNKKNIVENLDQKDTLEINANLNTLDIKKIPPWLWGIFLFLSLIILAEIVYLVFIFVQKDKPVENVVWQNQIGESEKLEGYPRALDGVLMSDDTQTNLWPVAVMLDNMIDARPQFGISKANLVIESLAEANITRFLAFFDLGQEIKKIGPVRSARPYFAEWAGELGAVYAHSGGSPEALANIKAGVYDIYDLNEFYNGNDFWRYQNRYAPHNLLTSTELLSEVVKNKVGDQVANYPKFAFKNEAEVDSRGLDLQEFEIYFNDADHLVKWIYNRETNDYVRYQGGRKHLDADGSEVRAKNVVIQKVEMEILDAVGRKQITTVDNKSAVIFQDGQIIEGAWKKENNQSRTKFYASDGQEIKFDRGITWIEVVPEDYEVKY